MTYEILALKKCLYKYRLKTPMKCFENQNEKGRQAPFVLPRFFVNYCKKNRIFLFKNINQMFYSNINQPYWRNYVNY